MTGRDCAIPAEREAHDVANAGLGRPPFVYLAAILAGPHGHRGLVDDPDRGPVRRPQTLHARGPRRPEPRRAPAAHPPLPALPPPTARADRSSAHTPALGSPHQVGGALVELGRRSTVSSRPSVIAATFRAITS